MTRCGHKGEKEQGHALDGFTDMDMDQFPLVDAYSSTPLWHMSDHGGWSDVPMQPMASASYLALPQSQPTDSDLGAFSHQFFNSATMDMPGMSETINPQVFQIPPSSEAFVHDPDSVGRSSYDLTMLDVDKIPEEHQLPSLSFDDLDDHAFSPPTSDIEDNAQSTIPLQPYQDITLQHGIKLSVETHLDDRKSRRPGRLSEQQTLILRNWYYLNMGNPYPNPDEMLALQLETELNRDQVRNWFNRTRARTLSDKARTGTQLPISLRAELRSGSFESNVSNGKGKGKSRSLVDNAFMSSESLDCHYGTTIPLSQLGASVHLDRTDPAESSSKDKIDINDWLRTMVEERKCRPRAPTIKINGSELVEFESSMDLDNNEHFQQSPVTMSPTGLAPDISDVASDMAYSTRSMQSSRTGRSHNSIRSVSSCSSRGSRRGRRRFPDRSRSPSQTSSLLESAGRGSTEGRHGSGSHTQHCPICNHGFKRKFTLQRHLKTVHELETRPWICNLDNLGNVEQPRCIFCTFSPPMISCVHKMETCEFKSIEDRSFWRRDHFMQHLELVHKVDKEIVSNFQIDLDQWRVLEAPNQLLVADLPNEYDPMASVLMQQQNQPTSSVRPGAGQRIKRTMISARKLVFGTSHKR